MPGKKRLDVWVGRRGGGGGVVFVDVAGDAFRHADLESGLKADAGGDG